MSKPHAHLQTMNKTSEMFQLCKDWTQTVGGVALTDYHLIAPMDWQSHFKSLLQHTSGEKKNLGATT